MADKIVVMHDGLVEQIGAPLELYDRPDNLFVAGFIGSPAMNFLKGTIRHNGSAGFDGPGGVRLLLAAAPAAADGRLAIYGVRPEHFAIADDGAETEIKVVEPPDRRSGWWRAWAARTSSRCFANAIKPAWDPAQARSAVRASVRRADRESL